MHNMNYIKQLQADVARLEDQVSTANAAVADLRSYLFSDKFHVDTTVQTQDVLNRLNHVSRALWTE